MHNNLPKISILLPVYNGEKFVREAILSSLKQEHVDFELIVLNDGSTDGTKDILESIDDERLRVYHNKENKGLVQTLNSLISLARYDWLARMDADDICFPNRLYRQLLLASDDPSLVAIGGYAILINEMGKECGLWTSPCSHKEIVKSIVTAKATLVHPATIFLKSAAEQVGGYHERFIHAEDVDFWLRLSEHGKLGCIEDPVLYFRQHADSVSHVYTLEQMTYGMAARISYLQRRAGLKEFDDNSHKWNQLVLLIRSEFAETGLTDSVNARAELLRYSRMALFPRLVYLIINLATKPSRLSVLFRAHRWKLTFCNICKELDIPLDEFL